MYAGPAAGAVDYFAERGHPCPDRYNPAEFLADLISVDTSSPEAEQKTRYAQASMALRVRIMYMYVCLPATAQPIEAYTDHIHMCHLICNNVFVLGFRAIDIGTAQCRYQNSTRVPLHAGRGSRSSSTAAARSFDSLPPVKRSSRAALRQKQFPAAAPPAAAGRSSSGATLASAAP